MNVVQVDDASTLLPGAPSSVTKYVWHVTFYCIFSADFLFILGIIYLEERRQNKGRWGEGGWIKTCCHIAYP